jgi:hypothetical protein
MLRAQNRETAFHTLSSGLQSFEVSQVLSSVLMLANAHEIVLNQPTSTLGDEEFTVKIRTQEDSVLEESDESIQCL